MKTLHAPKMFENSITPPFARRLRPVGTVAQMHPALLYRLKPIKRAEQPAAAGPGEAVEPEHLAGSQIKAHVTQPARSADAVHPKDGRRAARSGRLRRRFS